MKNCVIIRKIIFIMNNLEKKLENPNSLTEKKWEEISSEKILNQIWQISDNLREKGDLQNLELVKKIAEKVNFLVQNKQEIPSTILSILNTIAEKKNPSTIAPGVIKNIFVS